MLIYQIIDDICQNLSGAKEVVMVVEEGKCLPEKVTVFINDGTDCTEQYPLFYWFNIATWNFKNNQQLMTAHVQSPSIIHSA